MMKRRNIGALLLTFVLALSVCLGGCGRNEEKPEGAYAIYYLKQSGTELSRDYYMVQAAEPENMVTELWEQFIHVPDGEDNVSAFPTNVSLMGTTIEDRVLHFDFSKEYEEMEKEREVLLRAAIVLTFTQIPDVDSVAITVENQPLTDENSNPIGVQTSSNFVDIFGKGLNSATWTTLTLYFANETGDKLVKETREVALENSYPVEQYVLSLLIEGPQEEGHKATLPADLKILGVSTKDNICYVNFDSSFVSSALTDLNDYIPIYSVVNSLAEMTGVRKVQISIDGVTNVKFKDNISLEEPLDRNLDYVEEE